MQVRTFVSKQFLSCAPLVPENRLYLHRVPLHALEVALTPGFGQLSCHGETKRASSLIRDLSFHPPSDK